MINGQTKTGFHYEIDETKLDDMEFLELLSAANDDVLQIPKVLTAMLGEKQKKELYEHLRNENGKVPFTEVGNALFEIMESNAETKN